jgi:hypothetical protein
MERQSIREGDKHLKKAKRQKMGHFLENAPSEKRQNPNNRSSRLTLQRSQGQDSGFVETP